MQDIYRTLAKAIRLGNLADAEIALDDLASYKSDRTREAVAAGRADAAKAAGRPQALPPVAALILPVPGATSSSVLGDDPRERVRLHGPTGGGRRSA